MTLTLLLRASTLAAAATLAGCASMLLPANITPVVAATTSVDEANRKLASVRTQTAVIEAEFAASEQACYEKFFVNNCLDAAREKRRSALAYQKAIDVEAQYFKRKATADQRDREVAQAVKQFEADEARAAANPAPAPVARAEPKPARAGRPTLQERRAAQDAKLAERAARLAAEAPERAAKEREFEQRKAASARRQQEVAARLAQREAKKAGAAAAPADKK